MLDRLVIYRKAPDDLKLAIYDRVKPTLEREYAVARLSQTGMPFAQAFPEPPGLAEYRKEQEAAARAREEAKKSDNTSEAQRK